MSMAQVLGWHHKSKEQRGGFASNVAHSFKDTNYCAVLEVRTSNKTLNYVMEQFY